MAKYKRNSNLRATPSNNRNLDLYVPPLTPDFTQTTKFEIDQKYHKRPDLLAYNLYGDAKFWWVFALYNRNQLLDPINDFTLGTLIFVPNRNYIAGL
jgi:hypothetical protein